MRTEDFDEAEVGKGELLATGMLQPRDEPGGGALWACAGRRVIESSHWNPMKNFFETRYLFRNGDACSGGDGRGERRRSHRSQPHMRARSNQQKVQFILYRQRGQGRSVSARKDLRTSRTVAVKEKEWEVPAAKADEAVCVFSKVPNDERLSARSHIEPH